MRDPIYHFKFDNEQRNDDAAIASAFAEQGMTVETISRTGMFNFWVYVLTTCGHLYLLDLSHGGGGRFSLESEAQSGDAS